MGRRSRYCGSRYDQVASHSSTCESASMTGSLPMVCSSGRPARDSRRAPRRSVADRRVCRERRATVEDDGDQAVAERGLCRGTEPREGRARDHR